MTSASKRAQMRTAKNSLSSESDGFAAETVIDSIAAEVRVKRAELEGVGLALGAVGNVAQQLNQTRGELQATRARLSAALQDIELLRLRTASLIEPWRGHAGEKQCATGHRCANYIDAGKSNLTALSSVSTCNDYCSRTFKHIGFFAYHNEHGMLAFMLDPKGRCRCYDSTPCELVPDGGYNLWSSSGSCSPDLTVPGQAEAELKATAGSKVAAAASISLADPKAGA